jgi:hypothetical protein
MPFFDRPLNSSLKPFSCIWFQHNDLVFNATHKPVEKTHQVVWDSLTDYGRLK